MKERDASDIKIIPTPGIEPGPLRWKRSILATGPCRIVVNSQTDEVRKASYPVYLFGWEPDIAESLIQLSSGKVALNLKMSQNWGIQFIIYFALEAGPSKIGTALTLAL